MIFIFININYLYYIDWCYLIFVIFRENICYFIVVNVASRSHMCNMNDSCWIYHLILISCVLIWKEILHYSTHFSTTKLKHEAFISKISYMYTWYMGFVNIIEKKCKLKKNHTHLKSFTNTRIFLIKIHVGKK